MIIQLSRSLITGVVALGESRHLVVGERVVAEREPPVELEERIPVRRGRPSAAPPWACWRPRPGPAGSARRAVLVARTRRSRRRRGPPGRARGGPRARRRRAPSGRAPAAAGAGRAVARRLAARRRAVLRLNRARRENPWSSASHSRSASTTWVSSSTSCAWSTTTTPPPSSTSAGASTRRLIRTWSGRSASSGSSGSRSNRSSPATHGPTGGPSHRRRRWPRHRVGHRVEQLPDQVLGVLDRRLPMGPGARQGVQPVVVIGLQRPDPPGVAGLREPDPPGRDQLHRQQRGTAEQADRGVRVVDPHRPGEHRDRTAHGHPDGARRPGELDLAQPGRVAGHPRGAALQRYEAQLPYPPPLSSPEKLAGGPDSPAVRRAQQVRDQSSRPRIAAATFCGTLSSKTLGMM